MVNKEFRGILHTNRIFGRSLSFVPFDSSPLSLSLSLAFSLALSSVPFSLSLSHHPPLTLFPALSPLFSLPCSLRRYSHIGTFHPLDEMMRWQCKGPLNRMVHQGNKLRSELIMWRIYYESICSGWDCGRWCAQCS